MSAADAPPTLAPVPPDVHQRSGWIEMWQFWAALLAVLVVVAWRGFDHWADSLPGPAWHSPGPVASVHATWENNCSVCHAPFTPTDATNWLAVSLGQRHIADTRCTSCHAGVEHHRAEKPGDRLGCTACHREHMGRQASLVQMPDALCTRCHADLQAHLAVDARTSFRNVRRFDADRDHHPEYRILREKTPDPGTLKFNHRLHMTPGLTLTAGGKAFTLVQVDARYRPFYRQTDQGDDAPVELRCASCHQLDSRDRDLPDGLLVGLPLNAVRPVRSAGASMLPIVYEQHCQACHPLTIERKDRDDARSGYLAVRHRLQPAEIRTFLEAHYAAEALKERPARLPSQPLPGRDPDAEALARLPSLSERVTRAEQDLYLGKKTCGECHSWQPDPRTLSPDQLARVLVQPTAVKAVWLEHAVFDHTAHRQLDCRSCHANAAAQDIDGCLNPHASTTARDVLLPGISTCLECHAPRQGFKGGARFDCIECHRYHGGDYPLSGRGSTMRAGPQAGTLTIPSILEGPGR